MARKPRSRFWVVSTHVLTTGFALPLLGYLAGRALGAAGQLTAVQSFLLVLALQVIGYIGGTYYSLSYIRKVAVTDHPAACVRPSVIAFVVLAIVGFGLNLTWLFSGGAQVINPAMAIPVYLVCYVVISVAFARITRQGFEAMRPEKLGT